MEIMLVPADCWSQPCQLPFPVHVLVVVSDQGMPTTYGLDILLIQAVYRW